MSSQLGQFSSRCKTSKRNSPSMMHVPDAPSPIRTRAEVARRKQRPGGVERAPVGPFDLILYIGLAEYLDDSEVVHHLTAL